ncbi:MAG: sigma-70 family RNA polymerase sigma factor [Actinobacteria bacterium]|nr:sigma-70 family RNA polymerase sigma factor [Actinomycetota bacterium]
MWHGVRGCVQYTSGNPPDGISTRALQRCILARHRSLRTRRGFLLESAFTSTLAAAQAGAEWAWTTIYRDYSPAVLRYLRGHGAREAEDLLGEVFVQLVRGIEGFRGDERAFRTWVFMIAHNRLVDEWRAGRKAALPVPDEVILARGGTADVEDDALRNLGDRQVIEVLESLSTGQRDVLFLRLFARLTIEETASVMGKRPGAVKALQARGLAAIRRGISR